MRLLDIWLYFSLCATGVAAALGLPWVAASAFGLAAFGVPVMATVLADEKRAAAAREGS